MMTGAWSGGPGPVGHGWHGLENGGSRGEHRNRLLEAGDSFAI